MCAIVDANVINDLFSPYGHPAARSFLAAMRRRAFSLVLGGSKLDHELSSHNMRDWVRELTNSGMLTRIDNAKVDALTATLNRAPRGNPQSCGSNDSHIIALAQLSGARLLYTNDKALTQDFKNPHLINYPRGKIYSTARNSSLTKSHRALLKRRDLCKKQ